MPFNKLWYRLSLEVMTEIFQGSVKCKDWVTQQIYPLVIT